MNRQEILDYIKNNNLKEEIKQKFGRAYNSVPTTLLEDFIGTVEDECTNKVHDIPTGRKELWEYIKKNNLQEYIKEKTGKNYTIVSAELLHKICNELCCNKNQVKTIITPNYDVIEKTPIEKIEKTLRSMAEILNLKTVLKNLD